jgi:hypothetical protein
MKVQRREPRRLQEQPGGQPNTFLKMEKQLYLIIRPLYRCGNKRRSILA